MYKSITISLTLFAIVGFVQFAQAGVLYDFEPPTYALGPLDTQDGWIAGGGTVIAADVVAIPAGLPAAYGTQAATIGRWTDHSLAGAGFADVTNVGETVLYTAGTSIDGVEILLYGPSLNAAGKVAQTRIYGDSVIEYNNGGTWGALASVPGGTAWQVDMQLDFTAQQYTVTWTDLVTSTPYVSPAAAFVNACTVAQAEAGGYLANARSISATTTLYMDNAYVSAVPEPSTLVLLCLGLLALPALVWRKRK